MLTSNVRAANSIYPTTLHEYEQRRDYQNTAIVNCEQLLKELQRIVEIFEVDVNLYSRYVKDTLKNLLLHPFREHILSEQADPNLSLRNYAA